MIMEDGRCKIEKNRKDAEDIRQIKRGTGRKGSWAGFSYCMIIFLMFVVFHLPSSIASDKWSGVDESVIEKIAKEHGREAREPLINTDQGDLLLFLFLAAGAIGGFIAGYSWRRLTENRNAGEAKRKEKADGTA
jgi:ABC-type cobalt transport system substrate-binding protein